MASKPEELENDYDVQHVLKATKDFLMKIKYDGEKKGDLEKVIDDIDKAIQEGARGFLLIAGCIVFMIAVIAIIKPANYQITRLTDDLKRSL